MAPNPRIGREAHTYAADLDRQVLTLWPDAWAQMDQMRRSSPLAWPDWCLLPMGAAAAVVTRTPMAAPVAAVSALYAWRFARSVYVFEDGLADRLISQVPDAIDLDLLAGLPEWCMYIAAGHPEYPGSGTWLHLEYDVNVGRPELRILMDPAGEGLAGMVPVPVYLDRPSTTEALADFRASAKAGAGADVRGGALDAQVADLADRVDAYVALAAYLARPEADIVAVGRPGLRPVKPRSPVRGRTVWAVGYSA